MLLGDVLHARVVPFHGQGMNCAFEDCVALARHIADSEDFASAFAAFEAERLPNARAIQQMALENYLEMRDRVDDADYLLQRELERVLGRLAAPGSCSCRALFDGVVPACSVRDRVRNGDWSSANCSSRRRVG